jgi:hypothetical protein
MRRDKEDATMTKLLETKPGLEKNSAKVTQALQVETSRDSFQLKNAEIFEKY